MQISPTKKHYPTFLLVRLGAQNKTRYRSPLVYDVVWDHHLEREDWNKQLCAIILRGTHTRKFSLLAKGVLQRFFPIAHSALFALCSTVWLFNWRVIYIALPHHRTQHHSHSLTHSLRLPNSRSARRALKSMKKGLFIFSRESSRLQAARGAFLRPAGAAAAWLAGRSGPNLLVRPKVRGPWACRAPPPLDEKCLSCCTSPPPPSPRLPSRPNNKLFRSSAAAAIGIRWERIAEWEKAIDLTTTDVLINYLRNDVSVSIFYSGKRASLAAFYGLCTLSSLRDDLFTSVRALSLQFSFLIRRVHLRARGQENSPLLFGSVCVSSVSPEQLHTFEFIDNRFRFHLKDANDKKLRNNGHNLTCS